MQQNTPPGFIIILIDLVDYSKYNQLETINLIVRDTLVMNLMSQLV